MIQALFIQGFFTCSQLRSQKRKEILDLIHKINNKYYRSHSQRAGVSTLPEPGRDIRFNVNYTF